MGVKKYRIFDLVRAFFRRFKEKENYIFCRNRLQFLYGLSIYPLIYDTIYTNKKEEDEEKKKRM